MSVETPQSPMIRPRASHMGFPHRPVDAGLPAGGEGQSLLLFESLAEVEDAPLLILDALGLLRVEELVVVVADDRLASAAEPLAEGRVDEGVAPPPVLAEETGAERVE